MRMKLAVSAGALCLLLGTIAPVHAQHEREEAKPAPQAKPEARAAEHTAPGRGVYGGQYHGGVKPNGPTNGGVHYSGVPQHSGQVRSGFVQSRAAHDWKTEHRTWAERGGYNGYRIPDVRFHMYFGHEHHFRIGGLPLLFVGGYPRFQYDGFWFTFADPWPPDWAATWYETDDCYVDWVNDGYYLFDLAHPGVAIALNVSM